MLSPSFLKSAASPFLNRRTLGKHDALEQMADDIRVGATTAGCVTEADLKALGWSTAQIAQHGEAAVDRARTLAAG